MRRASGEENWFFKLSEFQEPLLKFYEEYPDFIRPDTRKNEIVTFVKGGLQDLSISRSTFDWGIPLPFDEGHVCYVWADALLAYFTGNGYADPEREGEFERRWPVQYHFVGKDITRFHCVIWPAMLMAAGLPVAKNGVRPWLLARGRREDVQVQGQRHQTSRPGRGLWRGRVSLLLHVRRPLRRRRQHLHRAHDAGL